MRQNTSIAPYFEALKVGLHIFSSFILYYDQIHLRFIKYGNIE